MNATVDITIMKRKIKDKLMRIILTTTSNFAFIILISIVLILSKNFTLKMDINIIPFIIGTIETTIIALAIATPMSILAAIFIYEFSPPTRFIIDILAGISPSLYGIFGMIYISEHLMKYQAGFSILSAGILLSFLVFPFMTNLKYEIIRTIPMGLKESVLGISTTRYEMMKVLLKSVKSGIIGSTFLGFSRGVGETIAVMMVVGLSYEFISIFLPGNTISAFIATHYTETMSDPQMVKVISTFALLLLIINLIFQVIGWIIVERIENE